MIYMKKSKMPAKTQQESFGGSEEITPQRMFGEYLHVSRTIRRVSLSNLAEAIGVNSSTISRWERGETFPNDDKLLSKISKTLGLDEKKVVDLLRLSAYPHESESRKITVEIVNPFSRARLKELGLSNKDIENATPVVAAKTDEEEISTIVKDVQERILKDVMKKVETDIAAAFSQAATEEKIFSIVQKIISSRKKGQANLEKKKLAHV